ncbi:PP2C family protein-serine/threonine phosphatase [Actinomadura sp. NPDC049753]|uniref:PP2C family protein-serine/threonine phosphatase n=1 Tax=Actinomadura sp. NPDC049753 TaxID=3154739 RepID=UPI003425E2A1
MGISEDPNAVTREGGLTWRVVAGWLVGITAALAVTGVALDRETGLAPFLVFLPPLIAGRGTVRQTAVASVWTILVIIGSLIRSPLPNAAATASVIIFAVALDGLSVVQAVRRVRQEREISRLRSAAAALQRQILRPFPLATAELVVHGLYEPVEEDSMVGGDVYEAMPTPYGSRVLIADVQGKGLPAISAAFAVLNSFREAALAEPTLTAVVDALENSVLRHNSFVAQTGEEQRFVTALILGIGSETTAQAINCGHIPPYQLSEQGTGQIHLGEASLPLGLASLSPEPRTVTPFNFPTDSTLLLCTDGITETRDPSGTFYPLEDRLSAWKHLPPAEIAPTVHHDLEQFAHGKLTDDRALLVLHRRPSSPDASSIP